MSITIGTASSTWRPFWITAAMLIWFWPRMPAILERTPGPVEHRKAEIVASGYRGDGLDHRFLELLPTKSKRRNAPGGIADNVSGKVDQIAHHGAAGWHHAGAQTVEHDIADGIAVDVDGIVGAIDARQHMVVRDEGRMHAHFQLIVPVPGNGQEFQAISELFPKFDIDGIDAGNPFDIDLVELDRRAKGNGTGNGQFVSGVRTLDIQGRIGFRVALSPGLPGERPETPGPAGSCG